MVVNCEDDDGGKDYEDEEEFLKNRILRVIWFVFESLNFLFCVKGLVIFLLVIILFLIVVFCVEIMFFFNDFF